MLSEPNIKEMMLTSEVKNLEIAQMIFGNICEDVKEG
jgi:hypothetical protein